MRIERVDDKTVKCYISIEEMREYDITYKDFVARTDKAKEIVEDIIAQATEEVGYKPPQFALDLQIMMLPEKGMVLTFSEKSPLDVEGNPSVLEYLKEMKKALEVQMSKAAGKEIQESSEPVLKSEPQPPEDMPDFAVFAFASLHDLCEYVKILPTTLRVISCLYKLEDTYYLYLEKGAAAYKRYSRACVKALEFGSLYGATLDKLTFIDEHARCLLPEKAIAKIRQMG
ncbi:MAG: adaptor protein MecA [Lachnospiraceae bacterium]|nr:adaptor protein MecA [Lachnospiraceae bacterium]